MTLLALAIAAYAASVLLSPSLGPPLVAAHHAAVPLALYAHLGGGAFALALGPWQFNRWLRSRALNVHRWTGRSYVAAVMVAGLGGLVLAPRAMFGTVTQVGFGLLAACWLATTLQAYRSIRRRDIAMHQQWMLRSYALTLAAVTLRIYLPLGQILGLPFPETYQAVSWLCWVPNLLVAELWFVRPARLVPVATISS